MAFAAFVTRVLYAMVESIPSQPIGLFRLQRRGEVSSTNDIVKEEIRRGTPEGFAVMAERQTGGYGRRGDGWISERGGLYLSVLLRPFEDHGHDPMQLQTLPLLVSVAVRRALKELLLPAAASMVSIKWPNDIVVLGEGSSRRLGEKGFSKLCGISVEALGGAACVGIGVNVRTPSSESLSSKEGMLLAAMPLKSVPIYLEQLGGIRRGQEPTTAVADEAVEVVCSAVLRHLTECYGRWKIASFKAFRDEYWQASALRDRDVCVYDDGADAPALCGRAVGVDNGGRLLLQEEGMAALRVLSTGSIRLQ